MRNHNVKFDVNKSEKFYAYCIMISKANFEPIIYKVDFAKMLNGEELMNFCFNEGKGRSSCTVTVMLKNLRIYNIDYDKQ